MSYTKMALNQKTALQTGPKPADVEVRTGLEFERYFTDGRTSPFDAVEWERRVALIGNEKGKTIFRQEDVEVPKGWSQTATNIVASKYFHGKPNTPEREGSVRQLISRVVNTIVGWGEKGGYFAGAPARDAFRDELTHLLVEQKMAFNSPVWFNVGVQPKPQCSACFINSVQDDMESIMNLAKTEGMLFKWGSGTGTNFSSLRGSRETLSGGGIASGPVSFMKGFDAFAGVIKSGGKTRRAAKMVILNVDHPDIVEFVDSKTKEERKARVLIEQGYDPSIDGEAYSSIFFQNANHSRARHRRIHAGRRGRSRLVDPQRQRRQARREIRARELLHRMAESAWQCGDPGMQYDTTVNRWHTCKATARINASNPCSEYMFLDDTACNLASLNLMKFLNSNGSFDVEAFRHAVDITITAQEILVDNASYPTPRIAENSHDFRPLGLGYANLGALLMSMALPYDSDGGRDMAGAVTALMCGEAYAQSARIAERLGPFAGYARQSRAHARRHSHAPRFAAAHQRGKRAAFAARRRAKLLGHGLALGEKVRLPQFAGHRARAHRHDRLHDGLRHHGHRAGPGAGEIQETRRWRRDQDRQQHRPGGAHEARLLARGNFANRFLYRPRRHDRGRARTQARALAGLRLLLAPPSAGAPSPGAAT